MAAKPPPPEPSPEELEDLSNQEMEAMHGGSEAAENHIFEEGEMPDEMIYDGEILSTGMTLAVVLPGDQKESYFPAKFTGRKQPHETDADLVGRCIAIVRDACLGQIDDAVDALAEYQAQLQARLNK